MMKMNKLLLAGVAASIAGLCNGTAQAADVSWLDEMRTPPQVLKRVMPEYPQDANAEGIEGEVVVRVTISKDGEPIHPQIVSSSGDSRLDQAALDSVSAWKFKPAMINGMKEATDVVIPIKFNLVDPEPSANDSAQQ